MPESFPVTCNVKDSKTTSVDARQVPLKLPCLCMHHLSIELEGALLFTAFLGLWNWLTFGTRSIWKGQDGKITNSRQTKLEAHSSCDSWRWCGISKQWQLVFHILQRAAEHNWWFPRKFVDYKHSKKGCFWWSSWRGKHSPDCMEVEITLLAAFVNALGRTSHGMIFHPKQLGEQPRKMAHRKSWHIHSVPGVSAHSTCLDVLHVMDLGFTSHCLGHIIFDLVINILPGNRQQNLKEVWAFIRSNRRDKWAWFLQYQQDFQDLPTDAPLEGCPVQDASPSGLPTSASFFPGNPCLWKERILDALPGYVVQFCLWRAYDAKSCQSKRS